MERIYHREVEQGSSEWFRLRLGIPTASRFPKILSDKSLKWSASAGKMAAACLGEEILGRPANEEAENFFGGNMWTEYGHTVEKEAREWYQMYREVTVERCGFVELRLTDTDRAGWSPDGLVGERGAVEIKCRGVEHHMAGVMGEEDIAPKLQIQGALWVSHRDWIDVVAYNPELPKRVERVYPIPRVQTALTEAMDRFHGIMRKGRETLAEHGDVVDIDNKLLAELAASVEANL